MGDEQMGIMHRFYKVSIALYSGVSVEVTSEQLSDRANVSPVFHDIVDSHYPWWSGGMKQNASYVCSHQARNM